MRIIRQSTSVDVPIGPFLDSTDGVTAETALSITQPDVRLKKNGGNWAQKNAAQTLAHEENGNYEVTLDATDTNTLGHLRVHVAKSGACPVWEDFEVWNQAAWDANFASGNFPANVLAIGSDASAPAKLAAGANANVVSTCKAGSSSSVIQTNLTEATNDHYKGLTIKFTSGALAGQPSDVTAYNGTTKELTVTALTEAPALNDAFILS